jgi:hypothetical protein
MSNTKQKTCQERIEEEYRRADDYLELMFRVYDDDLDEDDDDDKELLKQIEDEEIDNQTIFEYAAGSSMKRLLTIELSGGGPSSHIEAIINEDNVVESAQYVFLDWFDGARRKINEGSAMFRYVEWEAERYM